MYFHVYDDICDYYGGWPGYYTGFSDSNLKFNGGKIQKFSFPIISGKNTKFIYNDNGSHQSDSLTPTNNAYYWHNGSAWVAETGDRASAAAFVWDLNEARLAVSAGGGVKDYSICGLTPSTWVSRYNALSSTARGYVDSATIYTYKNSSSSGADTTVTFSEVMGQLSSMLNGSNSSKLLGQGLTGENSATIAIIVIISMVSAGAIGGYFFIRKRKENI